MEPLEPRAIIEAAEQAAAAGDYAAAEKFLREAARLQEATLGPLHPDLANTLNNLGVVCEITGNLVDAEHCFRRAVAIATTVLKPDHPFVATSRQNLRDFCEAQGKQVEVLLLSAAVTTTPETRATTSLDSPPDSPSPAESRDVQPLAAKRSIRPLVFGTLGPVVMLIMVLAAAIRGLSMGQAVSSSASTIDPPREIVAPTPEIPADTPAPVSVDQALPVEPTPIREATEPNGSDGERTSHVTPVSSPGRPTVVRAQLCGDLDAWTCDPADRPVPPGPLFFYTQIKSADATTIQHRWYQDNRLQHSVDLRVQASPRTGYRTYSRNVINGAGAGAGHWRIEVRTEDGVLLHEERFSVE